MENDLNEMTMRDLFAAFALAGLVANKDRHPSLSASHAYDFADAMIEQRNKDDAQL